MLTVFITALRQGAELILLNRVSIGLLIHELPFVFVWNDWRGSSVADKTFQHEKKILAPVRNSISQFILTIRPILSLITLICIYPWMILLLKSAPSPDVDQVLASIDRAMCFGVNPMRIMERIHSDLMSDWMAFCYTRYGLYMIVVIAFLFLREDQRALKNAVWSLSLALGVGYVGYTLFPALGPMYTQKFPFSLHFEFMNQLKYEFMDKPRIDRDCFPSLHTAITFLVSWIAWKEIRPLFWIFLPITITMPFSCVYLRYHYVTDVLAGTLLSIAIVAIEVHLSNSNVRKRSLSLVSELSCRSGDAVG